MIITQKQKSRIYLLIERRERQWDKLVTENLSTPRLEDEFPVNSNKCDPSWTSHWDGFFKKLQPKIVKCFEEYYLLTQN